ncbi:hypothetical protein KS4_07850 [Poriferisphaera corsica]|uniref:Uncharacterized protein n=1 Tax=Poriferisphaera corsica TaxID=2528020 RepID=A0A517YRE3_9BACT|nr:YdjY domain-containing protein [Poriferisphaera corsica]QDU32751.1 hypothetical protein KS4_07850 [Poriferisphaera corsica]
MNQGITTERFQMIPLLCFVLFVIALLSGCALAPTKTATVEATTDRQSKASYQQETNNHTDPKTLVLPGIIANLETRTVTISGQVCWELSDVCDWLELLACNPNTREYESLVVTDALPSHLHLALVSIGLKPGKPQKLIREEDGWKVYPATGDRVEIELTYTDPKSGEFVRIPASEWIIGRTDKQIICSRQWVFAGSAFAEDLDGQPRYMADENGTFISLVSFGDDVISSEDGPSSANDGQTLQPNIALIPPRGTPVNIVLRPAEKVSQTAKIAK